MAEQILFSKYMGNLGQTDSLFVQLTTETELSMTNVIPIKLEIGERFSLGSPIIVFDFIDGNGDLFNLNKPTPDIRYFLSYGSSLFDAVRSELRCVKTKMMNRKAGTASEIHYRMTFAFDGWNELAAIQRSRGWANTRTSDIVAEIARESGYDTSTISPTREVIDYIQPHWTNLKVISSLARKSSTEEGGCVEFGVDILRRMVFKSTGQMILEQKKAALEKKIPVFKLEGEIIDPATRGEAQENNNAPNNFYSMQISEDYMGAVLCGGGGTRAMYYDSLTDTFNDVGIKYSDLEAVQLSEWGSVSLEDENTEKRVFGGRMMYSTNEASNIVCDMVDSVLTFSITTERSFKLHIGDMVEVIIPTPISSGMMIPHNMFYSGFYLIHGITTVIDFQTSGVSSTIELMREGFDGKDLAGLNRSITGKFSQ